jgi:hypothetical protein
LLLKSGIIQFRDEQYWSWLEQKKEYISIRRTTCTT